MAAVHEADAAWTRAYNGGDLETVVGLYDKAAVLYPPGAPVAHGRAAIRAFFAKDIPASASSGLEFMLDPGADGGVTGKLGWSSGTYTVKDKSGRTVDTGWYFSVSEKKNGKWLYVRDAWNSNVAPAAAQAANNHG
mgnify:CR=1 FL=1